MSAKGIAADAVRQQDRDHVWHPLLQNRQLEHRDLMVMAKAQGCEITDADGRTYLDAGAGLWNVNVGYGREEICRAAYEQLQQLPYYPLSQANAPAAALAARLAEVLPGGLRHIYFSNSGSEANETAIKIARQYGRQAHPGQNRYKVIARYQGYHGWTCGALSATGQVYRRSAFEPLMPGFLHVDPPYCCRCPLRLQYPGCGVACAEQIEEVIQREDPETVAAVIAEPIIGGGGVIVPPDEYFPRLRQICDCYGVLLVLDEVITGFGRTGRLFGCQHWDVVPDIMTMAKGITSGYLPLGACAVTPKVFEAFLGEPGDRREFAQVVTYGGHPACCAAGLANLEILLGERLWENAAAVGAHLLEQLRGIGSPWLGEVRGRGLMIALELVDHTGACLDAASTARVKAALLDQGIIVGSMSHVLPGPESILFLSPPLILTRDQADRIVGAFRLALDSI
ncbi:MAG: aminotransferase [Gemmatimonadota bacterium]